MRNFQIQHCQKVSVDWCLGHDIVLILLSFCCAQNTYIFLSSSERFSIKLGGVQTTRSENILLSSFSLFVFPLIWLRNDHISFVDFWTFCSYFDLNYWYRWEVRISCQSYQTEMYIHVIFKIKFLKKSCLQSAHAWSAEFNWDWIRTLMMNYNNHLLCSTRCLLWFCISRAACIEWWLLLTN